MLKVEIKDDEGSKCYFCDGIQFNNTKNYERLTSIVLFNSKSKVKSNTFLLLPGDVVIISEELDF